jgi:amino-acid N-acetyltransferase
MTIVAQAAIRRLAPADLPGVLTLLTAARLPTADMTLVPALQIWVLESDGALIGAIAIEGTGADGRLLRSLVVAPEHQGRGHARALVRHAEIEAQRQQVAQLVILTETAQALFERLGYRAIDRGAAPRELHSSAEFQSLCPASAVCMAKRL